MTHVALLYASCSFFYKQSFIDNLRTKSGTSFTSNHLFYISYLHYCNRFISLTFLKLWTVLLLAVCPVSKGTLPCRHCGSCYSGKCSCLSAPKYKPLTEGQKYQSSCQSNSSTEVQPDHCVLRILSLAALLASISCSHSEIKKLRRAGEAAVGRLISGVQRRCCSFDADWSNEYRDV